MMSIKNVVSSHLYVKLRGFDWAEMNDCLIETYSREVMLKVEHRTFAIVYGEEYRLTMAVTSGLERETDR
jgi:hypothetical protein